MKRPSNPFLVLWTMAVLATTSAFVLHLTIRVKAVELGYELGRAQGQISRLREVRRVLELELASGKMPERVDMGARTLLGMSEPTADRIFPAGPLPTVEEQESPERAVAQGGTP